MNTPKTPKLTPEEITARKAAIDGAIDKMRFDVTAAVEAGLAVTRAVVKAQIDPGGALKRALRAILSPEDERKD